jgi:two-component system sensor histidine kinase RstB
MLALACAKYSKGFIMARLFFTLYLTIIGAVFAIFFAIDYITSKNYYNVKEEVITKSVESYSGLFRQIYQYSDEQTMLEAMHKSLNITDLILTPVDKETAQNIVELQGENTFIKSKFGNDFLVYFRMHDNKVYSVQPNKNSKSWQAERTLGKIYIFGFFFSIALILFSWVYFLQRKLKLLEDSANKMSSGDFSTRVSEQYKYRVGGLNAAFNKMAERVEQLIASHQRLTNAVAHELRTPIFRLRCQSELLEFGTPETEHNQYIEGIEEDLTELDQLVDEMLSYARMELNEERFQLERYELNTWINDHRIILQRSCKKSLSIEIGEKISFHFDSRLLMRALSNLVRNADIHAFSHIQIRYYLQENQVVISVEDDGSGIPETDRRRVIDPFERLDNARTRNSGGHGLGLSIVRGIAQQHGGKIFISQSDLGGACVSLYLPLNINDR